MAETGGSPEGLGVFLAGRSGREQESQPASGGRIQAGQPAAQVRQLQLRAESVPPGFHAGEDATHSRSAHGAQRSRRDEQPLQTARARYTEQNRRRRLGKTDQEEFLNDDFRRAARSKI